MDLWIRSQDKTELVKIEEVCIYRDEDGFIGIWSYGSNKHLKYYLGNYSTKERTLEVLDEIQAFIENDGISNITHDVNSISYSFTGRKKVYEMPKE